MVVVDLENSLKLKIILLKTSKLKPYNKDIFVHKTFRYGRLIINLFLLELVIMNYWRPSKTKTLKKHASVSSK
jgi:membrane protein CcdC involved in cytochrome C biogenesis